MIPVAGMAVIGVKFLRTADRLADAAKVADKVSSAVRVAAKTFDAKKLLLKQILKPGLLEIQMEKLLTQNPHLKGATNNQMDLGQMFYRNFLILIREIKKIMAPHLHLRLIRILIQKQESLIQGLISVIPTAQQLKR